MKIRNSLSRNLFLIANYLFLALVCIVCIIPFINLIAVSFSSPIPINEGKVGLVPVEFTLRSYEFVMRNKAFLTSIVVTLERLALGLALNMLLTILVAYPLSMNKSHFRYKNIYAWFFIITILFNGGLIPTYMVVRYTGLIDTIFALVFPTAVPVFNVIVLLNFFRQLPKEIEESAFIDGAGYLVVLLRLYLPLSKPALATIMLFCLVGHWNSWFDGLIYMNRATHYPLQSYLQTVVVDPAMYFQNIKNREYIGNDILDFINARTTKASQLIISIIPMLLMYPFLQKYFTKGLVLGSVKG